MTRQMAVGTLQGKTTSMENSQTPMGISRFNWLAWKIACIESSCVRPLLSVKKAHGTLLKSVKMNASGSGPQEDKSMRSQWDDISFLKSCFGYSLTKSDKIFDRLGTIDAKSETRKLDRLRDKLELGERTVLEVCWRTPRDACSKVSSHIDRLEAIGEKLETSVAYKVDRLVDQLATFTKTYLDGLSDTCSGLSSDVERLGESASKSMSAQFALDRNLEAMTSDVISISVTSDKISEAVAARSSACMDPTLAPVDDYSDPLGSGKRDWRLVFRGTAYNNVQFYPAYIHGTGIPAYVEAGCKQFNHSLPCVNHYRNRNAIDNWTNIDEVLFAIYAKDVVVKYIIFNGRGSTFTNWFEGNRVIASSWDDLKTKSHNIFSMIGDTRAHLMRRFLVNHHYNACPGDSGWFLVSDVGLFPEACNYEKKLAIPGFLYAKGRTFSLWSSQDTAWADAVGIFIKYQ